MADARVGRNQLGASVAGRRAGLPVTAGRWNEVFPGLLLTQSSLPTLASQIFTDSVQTLSFESEYY